MEENRYKNARLMAAEKNPELRTAEKACHLLYMSRERLQKIEQTDPDKRQASPVPEDVLLMSKVYKAPELLDYYCTHVCPIGKNDEPLIYDSLGNISTRLMSALYFLDNASNNIHRILRDSRVTEEEKKEFAESLKVLRDIAYSAQCLELWAQKNGLID